MTLKELISSWKADLPAYAEPFWKAVLFIPGYCYTFHHRLCFYLSSHWYTKPLFIIHIFYLRHLTYKYGIQMSWKVKLPVPFTIAHFGGITFFPEKCGSNIYLRQGVTVGNKGRGNERHPILGNNITFGANSIVVGPITVGDNVIIAAGAVVNKDVPAKALVGGVPAKIIKHNVNWS